MSPTASASVTKKLPEAVCVIVSGKFVPVAKTETAAKPELAYSAAKSDANTSTPRNLRLIVPSP